MKSQKTKLANFLSRHSGTAYTAKRLASTLKMPRKSVYNRLSDMRLEGVNIRTDIKTIQGKRVLAYRFG